MSSGLIALLDDVATLVKASAASLDDISTQVAKTTGKVSGIVIDDAAVTPKFVIGLSPEREIRIIFNIAKRSLINKLLILSPLALVLGHFAPWIISPILMIGGCYLCFEGYEKIHSILFKSKHESLSENIVKITPDELEKKRVASAVRTDLILSGEIVAITYSNILNEPILKQLLVMLSVGFLITFLVYGFVALIVKADDFGLYLVKNSSSGLVVRTGKFIVRAMPVFLKILSYVGTVAMLYVGFGIISHGLPFLHFVTEQSWIVSALLTISLGIILGFVVDSFVRIYKVIK